MFSSPPRSTEPAPVLEINTLNATFGQQAAEITRQQTEIDQLKAENASLKAADEVRERQLLQMRAADNARGIEMNRMKESSSKHQQLAKNLKERHDFMKEWYDSRNTTIVDGVKKITESSEIVRKRKKDDNPEDQGNPDPSATSEQPPATTSSQLVVYKPSQIESAQGTSSGTVEEIQQIKSLPSTSYVPSTTDFALQPVHSITGEFLEEGEIVSDLSHEQMLALNAMETLMMLKLRKCQSNQRLRMQKTLKRLYLKGKPTKQLMFVPTEWSLIHLMKNG
ncbi:hypothetical protein Hanom_Chr07g00601821 [Helianthus anomalus]